MRIANVDFFRVNSSPMLVQPLQLVLSGLDFYGNRNKAERIG